jgi:hypothetical protein
MSKVEVQLPESVIEHARKLAERDGISLDYFVSLAIAERISAVRAMEYLEERGRRGDREKFLAALRSAPDVEPAPEDRLD